MRKPPGYIPTSFEDIVNVMEVNAKDLVEQFGEDDQSAIIEELEYLILDLTCFSRRDWTSIQEETGLPDDRCKKMAAQILEISKKHAGKHRIEKP